jgi:hypothetical protein
MPTPYLIISLKFNTGTSDKTQLKLAGFWLYPWTSIMRVFLEYLINHLSDLKMMMNKLTQLKQFSYTLLMKTIETTS